MSYCLVSLNNTSNLLKNTGLKSREKVGMSLDGECIFLKGKVEILTHTEGEVVSASGRSSKVIKLPRNIIVTPSIDITTQFMSRANMCRMFLQPNPKLLALGTNPVFTQIIEPLTDDRIFVTLTCHEGVTMETLESLDHFMRLYVLS